MVCFIMTYQQLTHHSLDGTSHGKQILDMLRNPVVQTAGIACYFAVSQFVVKGDFADAIIAILHVPILRMGTRLLSSRERPKRCHFSISLCCSVSSLPPPYSQSNFLQINGRRYQSHPTFFLQ